jgi:hypothetical protein
MFAGSYNTLEEESLLDLSRKVKGVPVWIVAALLVCLVLGSAAAYIFATVKFSVNVEEPLSVVDSPSLPSLYPNMTEGFNVTVSNAAAVNYLVSMAFSLNDTSYQQSYVTFSNETYTVLPGLNNLTAQISVAPDAPPAQLELTVALSRVSATQPTFNYTFTWSENAQHLVNGSLTMRLNFTLTNESLLITAQINDTTSNPLYLRSLGILFDQEFDGFHLNDHGGYALIADNRSYIGSETRLGEYWFITSMTLSLPHPSSYHYCTFDNETGYTFHVHFPRSIVPVKTAYGQVLRVHVDFGDPPVAVEAEFAFEDYGRDWGR